MSLLRDWERFRWREILLHTCLFELFGHSLFAGRNLSSPSRTACIAGFAEEYILAPHSQHPETKQLLHFSDLQGNTDQPGLQPGAIIPLLHHLAPPLPSGARGGGGSILLFPCHLSPTSCSSSSILLLLIILFSSVCPAFGPRATGASPGKVLWLALPYPHLTSAPAGGMAFHNPHISLRGIAK